jgi:hypothetical protein
MKLSPPDILGLSNYDWNKNLNKALINVAKKINPKVFIIMGGPNIKKKADLIMVSVHRFPGESDGIFSIPFSKSKQNFLLKHHVSHYKTTTQLMRTTTRVACRFSFATTSLSSPGVVPSSILVVVLDVNISKLF